MDITQIKQQMITLLLTVNQRFSTNGAHAFNFQFNHNLDYQKFCRPRQDTSNCASMARYSCRTYRRL